MSRQKLREIRKAEGLSLEKLSAAVKISVSQLSRFETGAREPRVEEATKIAKALGCNVQEIFPELGIATISPITISGNVEPVVKSARVIGHTQAGVWSEFEDWEHDGFDGEEVPSIPGKYAGMEQFAYQVRGNSMDADKIFDGDYVVAVRYFDARADITAGDRVIVERVRNSAVERTVKQVEINGREIHFCPRSTDSRFKPIVVKISKHMKEADDTEVRLVGLVIFAGRKF